MFPELSNIQISYPFFLYTESDSVQAAFIKSIKYIRLFIYTQTALTAKITAFSPEEIKLDFFSGQNKLDDAHQVVINKQGKFIADPSFLHPGNSFIQFSDISDSNLNRTCQSCSLQLLPQVISPIKKGLQIVIPSSAPIKQKAEIRGSDSFSASQLIFKPFNSQLHFISGYNFQPKITNGKLQLAASRGAGKGVPSAAIIKKLIYPNQIQYSDSYYTGLHAINGITNNVQFAVSAGMYLQQTSAEGQLNLTIKRRGE